MPSIRTILHPTDFSEQAARAFEIACSLARDHAARLIVLHVVPTPSGEPRPGDEQERERLLRRLAPAAPELEFERRLEHGDVVAGILRTAGECRCDLIVMGTHGRSGLRRIRMGSVAESVLHEALCPVLSLGIPPLPSWPRTAPGTADVSP
jgi:nucleotide-binding universal stress UspA family protein